MAAPGTSVEPPPPPTEAAEVTASLTIGEYGEGWLVTRFREKECRTRFVLKSPDDIPALLRLIPRGARLRDLTSYWQTPPELLAALLPGHPEIEFLGLGSDRVRDEDLAPLAGLKQLRGLYLGTPHVTADGLAVLSGLRELGAVYFLHGRTPVTDDGLKALSGLTKLRCLRLDGTRITDAGLSRLRGLTRLETLDVSDSGVGRLRQWPDMPALAELWLSRTNVRDEDLPQLARYPRLRLLHLDRTKVTGKALPSLTQLERLQDLSLSNAPVTDDGVAHLARMPKLRFLHLSRTRVTDGCLPYLAQLPELGVLDLEWTKGQPPTGNPVRFRGMTWIRYRDGKMVQAGTAGTSAGSSSNSRASPPDSQRQAEPSRPNALRAAEDEVNHETAAHMHRSLLA